MGRIWRIWFPSVPFTVRHGPKKGSLLYFQVFWASEVSDEFEVITPSPVWSEISPEPRGALKKLNSAGIPSNKDPEPFQNQATNALFPAPDCSGTRAGQNSNRFQRFESLEQFTPMGQRLGLLVLMDRFCVQLPS